MCICIVIADTFVTDWNKGNSYSNIKQWVLFNVYIYVQVLHKMNIFDWYDSKIQYNNDG